jgi:DNA repair exonuclease SbcCD ATPase subunit
MMVKGKGEKKANDNDNKKVVSIVQHRTSKLDSDLDELFKLSLAEFTPARNDLAAQLKKSGRASEAIVVKSLAKPSVSAWAVNQLYWHHHDDFDELIAAGQRIRKFQTTGFAGKVAEMRAAVDERTKVLTHLSDLASSLLSDAGHSPTQDTLRRVTTTLEALSSYASLDDGPTPGRLTQDVDPPGFESLTAFSFGSAAAARAADVPTKKSQLVVQKSSKVDADEEKLRKLEETRQALMAAAKFSLQSAKKLLTDAQARAKTLEADEKKAYAEAKEAEKLRREAEKQFNKANAAAEDAAERAQAIADEAEEAAKEVDEARRNVEKINKELESLLR